MTITSSVLAGELLDRVFQLQQGLGKHLARGGEDKALVLAEGLAKNTSAVQPEACLVDDKVGDLLGTQTQAAEIHPGEIGAFRFDQSQLGETSSQDIPEEGQVVLQIGPVLPVPLVTVGVGGLRGN